LIRQPTIKPPVGYKIYLQSTLRIFYRLAGLTHTLDPLNISPMTQIRTSLARNSNSIAMAILTKAVLVEAYWSIRLVK
jgi:hypothetical protein